MLTPSEFEMVPRVDINIRSSKCDLGLWNLDATEGDEESDDTNGFAVG